MARMWIGSAFIILAFAGSALAGDKLQKFTSAAGRFTVEMPAKVAERTHTTKGGIGIHYFDSQLSLLERFYVRFADFPDATIRGNDPMKLLKAYQSGEYRNDRILTEKTFQFGKDKIPGLEYKVESTFQTNGAKVPVFIRERIFIVGTRLYIVGCRVVVNKNLLDSKEATRFLDSFATIP